MGAAQSKSEPIIFYNQNVPLQFSQGLVDSLETRQKSSNSSKASSEDVEAIVRERVAEELRRAQEEQEEISRRAYGDIAKNNIDKDHNSIAIGSDIEHMIQRIQRQPTKEIPTEIAECQEALIACYRNNESRVLDCWKEVAQFKESVAKAQKKFVTSHHA